MNSNETITFDNGWSRIKDEFIDKIESNLDTCNINDKNQKIIKLKANEYISYYKLVYDMCTQKDSNYSELLYNHLGQSLINYVKNKMCNRLEMYSNNNNKLIVMINEYWMKYKIYTNLLKGIFGYLDRFYVQMSVQPTIYEYSMAIFQKHVFEPYKVQLRNYLLDELDLKRTGNDVDENNLLMIVEMYNKLDSTMGMQYKEDLEPYILERCKDYYDKISPIWLNDLSLLDYIYIIEFCVKDEMEMANQYLNKSTDELLYNTILTCLLTNQEDNILGKINEMKALIEDYQINDLKIIYKYINKLKNVNQKLVQLLNDFVSENSKNSDFNRIVDVYNKYLYMISFSFENKCDLLVSYNDSFKTTINNNEFVNKLLFQFHNHLCKLKYKCKMGEVQKEDERSHQESKGLDLQNKHDVLLDDYVNVYNQLVNKGEFMRGYRTLLCYRLLYEHTDPDEELKSLQKIMYEDHMNHLYKMVDDIRKSNHLYLNYTSQDYRNMSDVHTKKGSVMAYTNMSDNTILTVSNLYWPISTKSEYESVKINENLEKELSSFQDYYKMNNKFKKIQYNYEYSFVEIDYYNRYPNSNYYDYKDDCSSSSHQMGTNKVISCNMVQATLLLMFNNSDSIRTEEIMDRMNLTKKQLKNLLDSSDDLFREVDGFVDLNLNLLNTVNDFNLIKKTYEPFLNVSDYTSTLCFDEDSERLLDNQSCLDSVIVKVLKRYKKLNRNHFLSILEATLKETKFNLKYDEHVVMDRVNVLINKEYINQIDDFLIYIP